MQHLQLHCSHKENYSFFCTLGPISLSSTFNDSLPNLTVTTIWDNFATNWWYFPEVSQKIGIEISCKLSTMERQFAWNVKPIFLEKLETYFKMLSAEIFTQHTKNLLADNNFTDILFSIFFSKIEFEDHLQRKNNQLSLRCATCLILARAST